MEWYWIVAIVVCGLTVLLTVSSLLYKVFFKRFYDITFSCLAIVLISPLLLVIAVLVHFKLGSPVIFKQERPGRFGKLFKIYKFRTMLAPQTRDGRKITDQERLDCIAKGIDVLSDEERLTGFGRALRAMSLDELPEFFNIIKGDMSIIGPRPLATIYLPFYTEEEMHRHDVRPGLTGLAQVHGRNTASWEKRFEYDLKYVNNISLFGDIKILVDTVMVVLKKSDIGQGEERPESFCDVRQRQWEEAKKEENKAYISN